MSDITLDDVKRRAAAAGIALREDKLEAVRKLLADALKPLRGTDSHAIRTIEPAVTFDATGGARDGGR
jgi:hypothetical protein